MKRPIDTDHFLIPLGAEIKAITESLTHYAGEGVIGLKITRLPGDEGYLISLLWNDGESSSSIRN